MQTPGIQADGGTTGRLRMVLLLAALLYVAFGFVLEHVVQVQDLIRWTHRVGFALAFLSLAVLSYRKALVRNYLSVWTYALACLAVLHLLHVGSQAAFDPGALVELLLVIAGGFSVSRTNWVEGLLFFVSSAAIAGASFWFTLRLAAAEEPMYRQKAAERSRHRHQAIARILQALHAISPREQRHPEVGYSILSAVND